MIKCPGLQQILWLEPQSISQLLCSANGACTTAAFVSSLSALVSSPCSCELGDFHLHTGNVSSPRGLALIGHPQTSVQSWALQELLSYCSASSVSAAPLDCLRAPALSGTSVSTRLPWMPRIPLHKSLSVHPSIVLLLSAPYMHQQCIVHTREGQGLRSLTPMSVLPSQGLRGILNKPPKRFSL